MMPYKTTFAMAIGVLFVFHVADVSAQSQVTTTIATITVTVPESLLQTTTSSSSSLPTTTIDPSNIISSTPTSSLAPSNSTIHITSTTTAHSTVTLTLSEVSVETLITGICSWAQGGNAVACTHTTSATGTATSSQGVKNAAGAIGARNPFGWLRVWVMGLGRC